MTNTRRLARRLIPALAVATGLVLGQGTAYAGTPTTELDRYELVSDDADDPVAECLVILGWHGDPTDQQPVIYAPRGDIAWCVHLHTPAGDHMVEVQADGAVAV